MTNYYLTGRIENKNISISRVATAIALGKGLPVDVAATVAELRQANSGFAAQLDTAIAGVSNTLEMEAAIKRHPQLEAIIIKKGTRSWRKYAAAFDAKATR